MTRRAHTRLASTLEHRDNARCFFKHGINLLNLTEEVWRNGGCELFHLGVWHICCQQTASTVQCKVLLIQDASKANQGGGRCDLLTEQIKDFSHPAVTQLLQVDEALDFRQTPEVVVQGVGCNLDEGQLAFQEHGLVGTVIDDDIWVCFGDNLIVRDVIVPDVELGHLNRLFCNLSLVAVHASKVEVDITVHGRVALGEDDALNAVSDFGALVLHTLHTGYDAVTLGVQEEL